MLHNEEKRRNKIVMVRDGNGAGAQTLMILLEKEQRMQDV